ncbi:2-oxo acid dehydrogenase subunit E2 [Buchnera aphidicola]|uniref:2-oxo acid dehydrogenase subunit E2 n=1 Tax=Buchnera aphidicola TaxID=9 RepID=UPI0031B84EF6
MDTEIKIPDIGIDQAEVIEILVHVNDYVKKEQGLIVIEGEKASMEIPSPHTGIVKEIKVKISDIVKKNSIIMIMQLKNTFKNQNTIYNSDKDVDNIKQSKVKDLNIIYASPIIRRLARSKNIDLHNIVGSGRKNRIIKKDIDNYINDLNSHVSKNNIFQDTVNPEKNNCNKFGEIEKVIINKIKKRTGDVLSKNWSTIPHVTQFDEIDITDLENFRIQYNQSNKEKKNNKLTLLTFVVKAISKGLEKYPYFNSSISRDGNTIYLKKYINIGIAVDTNHGLIVPVIKNVKNKNLFEISQEIFHKSNSARQGNLNMLDIQGGCFTISSLGGIGGTYFSPIINGSEAAILGISRSCYKPIWNGKIFVPKLMLPISLSYNHCIIDGADGARFITYINKILSDIRLLLI